MSRISTHVLNTSAGKPVSGMDVVVEHREVATQPWTKLGQSKTDGQGRIADLMPANCPVRQGFYCLRFDSAMLTPFFPEISIQFVVADAQQDYHVPLLLSEFGYTTYLGI